MATSSGKDDELFVFDQLIDLHYRPSNEALFETIQIMAKQLGIHQLNGRPVEEFFDTRRREIAEYLIADFADTPRP